MMEGVVGRATASAKASASAVSASSAGSDAVDEALDIGEREQVETGDPFDSLVELAAFAHEIVIGVNDQQGRSVCGVGRRGHELSPNRGFIR